MYFDRDSNINLWAKKIERDNTCIIWIQADQTAPARLFLFDRQQNKQLLKPANWLKIKPLCANEASADYLSGILVQKLELKSTNLD